MEWGPGTNKILSYVRVCKEQHYSRPLSCCYLLHYGKSIVEHWGLVLHWPHIVGVRRGIWMEELRMRIIESVIVNHEKEAESS